jgi:hypothetical protein
VVFGLTVALAVAPSPPSNVVMACFFFLGMLQFLLE